MHRDQIKGKIKEGVGKLQEQAGMKLNSPEDVAAGRKKQVEGKVDKVKGKVKDTLHKAID